jgi:hypothetical protein
MKKCIIFDLDETIGYFTQIYITILRFESLYSIKLDYKDYHNLFNEYENIFRPGIFILLAYLNALKKKYPIKIILYTNTTMCDSFINDIIRYINKKIHSEENIFDNIITLSSSCRKYLTKQFTDLHKCINYLTNGYVFLIIDNEKQIMLDKLYSKLIIVTSYRYLYLISNIWNTIHKQLNIKKKYNILDSKIIDGDNNIEIYDKCKNDILKLFPIINKFININI